MIQVNPGECSLSTIELEQGQDSHLTSNQQFQTHSYFGVGIPNFSRKIEPNCLEGLQLFGKI